MVQGTGCYGQATDLPPRIIRITILLRLSVSMFFLCLHGLILRFCVCCMGLSFLFMLLLLRFVLGALPVSCAGFMQEIIIVYSRMCVFCKLLLSMTLEMFHFSVAHVGLAIWCSGCRAATGLECMFASHLHG